MVRLLTEKNREPETLGWNYTPAYWHFYWLRQNTHTHTVSGTDWGLSFNSCHKLLMFLKLKDTFSLHVCVHVCSHSAEQKTQGEDKCVAVELRDLYVLHKFGKSDWDRLCNIEREQEKDRAQYLKSTLFFPITYSMVAGGIYNLWWGTFSFLERT